MSQRRSDRRKTSDICRHITKGLEKQPEERKKREHSIPVFSILLERRDRFWREETSVRINTKKEHRTVWKEIEKGEIG